MIAVDAIRDKRKRKLSYKTLYMIIIQMIIYLNREKVSTRIQQENKL